MIRMTMTAVMVASCGTAIAGGPNNGPDVICGVLTSSNYYGQIGGTHAFSVGTTSCNIGNMPALWEGDTADHPVISQTIWRYDNSEKRLTQVGIGHVKHSFAALQENDCGLGCSNNGGWQALGSGCSDPYSASLNGGQSGLGPRSEINAFNGEIAWPFTSDGMSGNAIYKRIQVQNSEIDLADDYYVEGAYVLKDEIPFGNQFNNVSWRAMSHSGAQVLVMSGPTVQMTPAIQIWQDRDPSVTLTTVDVPGEGRFIVASKAKDMGGGVWRYEYGVYNQNSDRSAASFTVPATGTSNYGFHDVNYHDSIDDNISPTDWAVTEGATSVSFSTPIEAMNPNANAIRWGTMYNFWFDANTAPTTGDAEIGLFRAGSPSTVLASIVMPSAEEICTADLAEPFGTLNLQDVFALLALFNAGDNAADLAAPFGTLNLQDVFAYLADFNAGCK
ncbi:MAG: hypothetical protein JKY96_00955 [Phycisphaerales bacterium]|nr:hypothetical protein [Phycisphaerales bacterium]